MTEKVGFMERINKGETVLCAEGYLFEFERRGYLKAGAFVPEIVLEHPEMVKALHEEFVHAGSDVVLAFTYYGHREKLRLIGKEDLLEKLNRKALKIAKEVADETGTLLAGNICNTTVYKTDDIKSQNLTREMFKEQIEWAVEAGVDFIVAETFLDLGEAILAVQCVKEYGNGIPVVCSLNPSATETTLDGVPYAEACRQLEEEGADVVGLNCGRGPDTIMPLMEKIRAATKGPLCCLVVPYRTTPENPTFQSLRYERTGKQAFPFDLQGVECGRTDIKEFGEACKKIEGLTYVGICCGNCGNYFRVLAEELGRTPPASRFSPDISQHFIYGDKTKFSSYFTEGLKTLLSPLEK